MYEHVSYHTEWAKKLKQEIDSDSAHDWFHPKGRIGGVPGPGDFDYGRMKFVNRNLNYFYTDSMISHAVKNDYQYNPSFPAALEFCNNLRVLLNEPGPFGRMCIWKLVPNGYLLPHYDRWGYHYCITRYIFCISDHAGAEATIRIKNTEIEVKQGLLFNFYPAIEMHEFINHTDRDWNFMGFDYWRPELLQMSLEKSGINDKTEISYTDGFGTKQQKYMSNH
jgi:hypothetical protein